MATVTKVQRHFQITLPASLRKRLGLKEGDLVELELQADGILVRPVETIDRSQAWFWSKRWQEEERKVEEDFRQGRVKVSETVEEFIRELDE